MERGRRGTAASERTMDILLNGAKGGVGSANGNAADWIKDGGIDNFVEDVLEASAQVPVIVSMQSTSLKRCSSAI